MITSPIFLTLLLLCGAALSLVSAAAGAILALWCAHVARTGCSPMPSMPSMRIFKRRVDEDDDDDTNGQHVKPRNQPRVGP